MAVLNSTPPDKLVDARGRPYFLWDMDMDLDGFRVRLADPDLRIRAYFAGKLLRQAKPDDVFLFISAEEIALLWPRLKTYLGRTGPFWAWFLEQWEAMGHVRR